VKKNSAQKYLVRTPLIDATPAYASYRHPLMTYMSSRQVPGADYRIELGWITGMPQPAAPVRNHVHDSDQIVLFLGADHKRPQVLGGEIEFGIGDQPVVFNTSAGIYIPGGLPHGPVSWKQYHSPQIQMSLMLGSDGPVKYEKGSPREGEDFDYEQYVIRSPMREAGAEFSAGRTSPTMTYMSGVQIPGVKTYIELGWTFGMPRSKRTTGAMPEMVHTRFDEIVLHIGGDPENPQDLGADMLFYVEGQPLTFNTTSALFIPRGTAHGPIRCLEYRKPHLVMAIMCGAGNIREGWADGFKPEPGIEQPK
jgi:hypothetical protein